MSKPFSGPCLWCNAQPVASLIEILLRFYYLHRYQEVIEDVRIQILGLCSYTDAEPSEMRLVCLHFEGLDFFARCDSRIVSIVSIDS